MNCPLCQLSLNKDPLSLEFSCPDCGRFLMSHGFNSALSYLKIKFGQIQYDRVLAEIKRMIKADQEVIAFVEDYEKASELFPRLIELSDICDRLGIDIIGISCGSDYGD